MTCRAIQHERGVASRRGGAKGNRPLTGVYLRGPGGGGGGGGGIPPLANVRCSTSHKLPPSPLGKISVYSSDYPTWKLLISHFRRSFLEYGINDRLKGIAILVLELCHVGDVGLWVIHHWQDETLPVLDPLKLQLKQDHVIPGGVWLGAWCTYKEEKFGSAVNDACISLCEWSSHQISTVRDGQVKGVLPYHASGRCGLGEEHMDIHMHV